MISSLRTNFSLSIYNIATSLKEWGGGGGGGRDRGGEIERERGRGRDRRERERGGMKNSFVKEITAGSFLYIQTMYVCTVMSCSYFSSAVLYLYYVTVHSIDLYIQY